VSEIAVSLNNLRLEAFSVTSVKETVVSLVVVLWHWVGLVGWVVEVVDRFWVFLLADVLTKQNVGVDITLTMVSIGVAESMGQFIFDVVYIFHSVVRCIVMSLMVNSVGVFVGTVWVKVGLLMFVFVRYVLHGSKAAVMVSEAGAVVALRVRSSE